MVSNKRKDTEMSVICHKGKVYSYKPRNRFPHMSEHAVLSYKRASERAPTIVAKRNARERTRVNTVNAAFERLQVELPVFQHRVKRVSKLRILEAAIDYILELYDLLGYGEAPPPVTIDVHGGQYHTMRNDEEATALLKSLTHTMDDCQMGIEYTMNPIYTQRDSAAAYNMMLLHHHP